MTRVRPDNYLFRCLLAVVSVVMCSYCLAQKPDMSVGPPNIVVNVPKADPPVINLPNPTEPPMWPTYVGMVVGVLGTFGTLYAALAAMRAAKATEETVEQMRKAEVEQARPYVVVSLELDRREHWFDLVMRNLGRSPAIDVSTKGSPLDPLIASFTRKSCAWPNVIPSLAPGQEMRIMVGPQRLFHDNKTGWHPDISFQIEYRGQDGVDYEDAFSFSFQTFEATRYDNSGKPIERALEKIADNTALFHQGPFRDQVFWRVWKSLVDSRLELVVEESDEGMVLRFRKGTKEPGPPTTSSGSGSEGRNS